jgi:hypothetical protein
MKCFFLFCNITVIYCLKYGIVEIKEYFIHLFVLCAKDVTFLYVIHVSTLSSASRDSSVGIATGYGLEDQGGQEFESQ